jgi:hypothetical protein
MKKKFQTLTSFQRFFFYPFRWILIRFFPKMYLNIQYRFITGHALNLKKPRRYTEKLQYLRWFIYPKNQHVIEATDRAGLRGYVKRLRLSKYLIPIQGIFDCYEDIPFKTLKRPYVIKATHGSNMNHFVKKDSKLDLSVVQKKLKKWLKTDYGQTTLEPHYSFIKPKLIIENFIESNHLFPIEYKIHVFHGVAKFLYVVTGRGQDIRYTLFDRDWKPFDGAQFNGWKKSDIDLEKPASFVEMLTIAETLAKPFPFVRVDLYAVLDKIYISELTFTPAKGTLRLDNDDYDMMIGSWLNIHEKN